MPRQYTPRVACTCAKCGKQFERRPSHIDGKTYCSSACYHAMPHTPPRRGKRPPETFICKHCGREAVRTSHAEGVYCSRACHQARPRVTTRLNCPTCGVSFETTPAHIKFGRKYCSYPCAMQGKHTGQHGQCAYCGVAFYIKAHLLQSGRRRYRSTRCKGLAMRRANYTLRNAAIYGRWRTAVYRRDNYTCQRCQAHGVQLNAHHIKSYARHPHLRLDVSNGITLCVPCHVAVHAAHP